MLTESYGLWPSRTWLKAAPRDVSGGSKHVAIEDVISTLRALAVADVWLDTDSVTDDGD